MASNVPALPTCRRCSNQQNTGGTVTPNSAVLLAPTGEAAWPEGRGAEGDEAAMRC